MLAAEEPLDVVTMVDSDVILDLLLQFVRNLHGILISFERLKLVVKVANTVLAQTKRAVYVPTPEVPLDLQLVSNAWENLPKETRTKIVHLVLEALE